MMYAQIALLFVSHWVCRSSSCAFCSCITAGGSPTSSGCPGAGAGGSGLGLRFSSGRARCAACAARRVANQTRFHSSVAGTVSLCVGRSSSNVESMPLRMKKALALVFHVCHSPAPVSVARSRPRSVDVDGIVVVGKKFGRVPTSL